MKGILVSVGACATAMVALSGSASGVTIQTGTYQLHNHPDGSARPPYYGARLDELYNVTGGHDIFTFNFDAPGANMRLDYDGSSIHIYGTAYGGLDIGSAYANDVHLGFYTFDFTYSIGVGLVSGDDDLGVVLPDPPPYQYNYGTVTTPSNVVVSLRDGHYDDGTADFRFGDYDDENGWRGFDGISGWGWLFKKRPDQSSYNPYVADSDWLFTAELIPGPGAVGLGAASLAVVGLRRRRLG